PRNPDPDKQRFCEFLKFVGYHVVSLPLREVTTYEDGIPQQKLIEKGLDCEIVYDMVKLSQEGHYDTFILVAGDEDYARTIKRIQQETATKVELAFFDGNGCSNKLRKEASKFIDLQSIKEEIKRNYINTSSSFIPETVAAL
ncbi:unnamed protein product, partial [marine sediment metagenome]